MNFYPEKSTGRVRLEVIVEDTIFVPWEETFIVEGAKKVTVQIKSQKKVDVRF
jgi:aromatic ring hydroxylase